jgi:hypothetical protein
VKVKVEVIGDVKHEKGVFHRRRVTGKQRIEMANLSKEKGPTETFYDNLANASRESLDAGNYNNVPTKPALRKMIQELMNEELMDRDVFREVDIVSQIVEDFMGGEYLRYQAKKPFGALLYTDTQVKLFSDEIRKGTGALFLDATGSVISKLPDQSAPVFYYAAVTKGMKPNDPPIPIVEFITNRHTVPDIGNFLLRFQYALQQQHKKYNVPQTVVVDYSWAMIHAVNYSFNHMTTGAVIDNMWNNKRPSCLVHICCAHLMHSFARYLRTLKKDVRMLLLRCVAKFVTSKSLASVSDLFAAMCGVFF